MNCINPTAFKRAEPINPLSKLPMKRALILPLIVVATLTGCGKKPTPNATAEQLKQSFAKAEAPQQDLVAQAGAALKSGDYTRALQTVDRAVQMRPADAAQKQAVGQLILQTRQAVQKDPQLNTPQLYKAMADLIQSTHGEN